MSSGSATPRSEIRRAHRIRRVRRLARLVRRRPHRRPGARTAPGAGEVAIRVRAVAINPLDTMKQHMGDLMYRWLPHPAVLGEDVAGVVEEVGPGVTRFAVGDRVVAYAVGMEKGRRHAPEGGFQTRAIVRTDLAAPIPDALRFEDAAVLPLGVSTAASGLFGAGQLGLRMPDAGTPATGRPWSCGADPRASA
ncbi:alcohol dehydrogenase catalytic domain-containing protein [Clavibacter tessellarius]|uniref:alcohol dehydrogenase catalytic domain-containing protein n=1 Tax=Clavibacter tessellarius TaxID=31965 RepID=UPI003252837F